MFWVPVDGHAIVMDSRLMCTRVHQAYTHRTSYPGLLCEQGNYFMHSITAPPGARAHPPSVQTFVHLTNRHYGTVSVAG
jgi:hypothetical protein